MYRINHISTKKKKNSSKKERSFNKLDLHGITLKNKKDIVSLSKINLNLNSPGNSKNLWNKVSKEIITTLLKYQIEPKLLTLVWATFNIWEVLTKEEELQPPAIHPRSKLLVSQDTSTIFRNLNQRANIMPAVWTGKKIWKIWPLPDFKKDKEFSWSPNSLKKEPEWMKN